MCGNKDNVREAGNGLPSERHPLEPFLPERARLLMLGSFPPKREKWSMDFFYPNFNNDMWRIMGLVFFGDKTHFITGDGRHFDKDAIMRFCAKAGIALFDTASEVKRLKDNASDKFLEIVEPTDIGKLLDSIPECHAVAVIGQKAAETAAGTFGCEIPAPGNHVDGKNIACSRSGIRECRLWRMPSSSRAYPLALEKKADLYRKMFMEEGIL